MSRNATTLALLALTGSAGLASAQVFIPMNAPSKNYNEARSNTANGIVAFDGHRTNGDPVAGLWDWRTDTVFEMPPSTDDMGNLQEVVSYQFRPMPGGQPFRAEVIPGVDIVVRKTPAGKAAYWDTRASNEGVMVDLDTPFGMDSWSTNASADASIIAGALYGDLDGNGVSRHAVKWVNSGAAQLMPVPAGTRASEVWWTSDDGYISCGAISEQGMPSDKPKMKPATSTTSKGILWNNAGGDPYRIIEPSSVGAESLVLTALSSDNSQSLIWAGYADGTTRGGAYNIDSDAFTLLDGGDINGDGQINLFDRHDSAANAFSADGSVIGGSYTLPGGPETAAFWTAADNYQMHDLASYLMGEGAVGVDGWHLSAITGVSADGTVFSGSGYNPGGQADVWVAVVPAPASASLLALGGLLAARRTRR